MSTKPIRKLLVANRSEIATRVFRAANELQLRTVAIYAKEDRFSMHRFKADESYQLDIDKGPVGAYLDVEGIVTLAVEKGVDAIHPGYGFLAENADFARACARAGIIFVGPRPEILELMGDKVAARAAAHKAGLPTLPGTEDPVTDREEALKIAHEIGFPLIIKAAFGGGGRGMRVVEKEEDLAWTNCSTRPRPKRKARLRQRRGVPREVHRPRKAYRSANTGRSVTEMSMPPPRAGLFRPAPPPESHRDRPVHRSR